MITVDYVFTVDHVITLNVITTSERRLLRMMCLVCRMAGLTCRQGLVHAQIMIFGHFVQVSIALIEENPYTQKCLYCRERTYEMHTLPYILV